MNIDYGIIIVILGIMVFLTNVIVEVLKNTFTIKGSKTLNSIALTAAITISVLGYLIYTSYTQAVFIWYYLIASVLVGFIVALISMIGWDKVLKIWKDSTRGGK